MFISLEGPDGVGKTTQVALLAERLRAAGVAVVECREPGGTDLGERVRALLLGGDVAISDRSEALLFAAARAQLVDEVIRPALAEGAWVVCDRFIDSSVVYQGVARGLGVESVLQASLFATGGLLPERTLVREGTARRDAVPDRMEAAGEAFHARVSEGFGQLAGQFPERVLRIDASGAPAAVAARVWAVVAPDVR